MQIIKATGPAQFLSLVPALMGVQPTDSVVFVFMRDGRTRGVMRLDAPTHEDQITQIAGMVARTKEDQVHIIHYADGPALDQVWSTKMAAAIGGFIDVAGVFTVGSDGWTYPPDWDLHPLAWLDPDEDAPPAPPSMDELAAIEPADDETFRAYGPTEGVDNLDLSRFEKALTEDLGGGDLFWLGQAVSSPLTRDVLLIGAARDLEVMARTLVAQLEWVTGHIEEIPGDIGEVMWGGGARPNAKRLERLATNLRRLLGCERIAGGYAALAWANWALGRSALADRFVDAALEIEPDHGLARIIAQFVDAGHLPDWAFRG